MSQHKGPKGPAHRAVKIEAQHHEPLRPHETRLLPRLRNLASREQRRGAEAVIRSLLLCLVLLSSASACPAIQDSSGIPYYVYDHEVLENNTVVLWIDPLVIDMLDAPSEGIIFRGVDEWQ